MNDYNDGLLPEPCMRLPYGWGSEWKSIELGDGTGYVRLDVVNGTCKRERKPNCTICSECRYVLHDEWKYCPHCGRRIEEDE